MTKKTSPNSPSDNITARQRITAALQHKQCDRIAMIETLFWPQTLERWHKEGLPENADITEYFGLDLLENFFGIFDCSLGVEPEIIEETEDFIIQKNNYGSIVKQPRKPFVEPAMLVPAIKNRNDWNRLGKNLQVDRSRFTDHYAIERSMRCRAKGGFVMIETIEPLWFVVHNTMGYEGALYAMADDPQLIEEMIAVYTDFSIKMLELCFSAGFDADALFFASDLCYRGGMLFSPDIFRDLASEHLKKFKQFCEKHDLYFIWHCDGNVADFIGLLIEIGVDAIHPLEARAGNDVRDYKNKFGDSICLIGNIDADIVAAGNEKAIENEVAKKIPTAKQNGGYIYHIDHSVPPTISLKSYKFLLKTVRDFGPYNL